MFIPQITRSDPNESRLFIIGNCPDLSTGKFVGILWAKNIAPIHLTALDTLIYCPTFE